MNNTQIQNIALQVALALQALHKQGYACGNICPENILLDAQGYVTIRSNQAGKFYDKTT